MTPLLAASSLADWFASWPGPEWLPAVLAALVHVLLLLAFFGLPAGIFIWAERKVSARIQDRLGPTRVGGRFGWLQSLADGIKLLQKEDLAPASADKFLFRLAPYIVVVASFCAFMFLPFSNGWVAVAMDCGLFIALAVLSLEVLGVVLAGYSSGSKWSLFGGMREAAQMVSYEIPLGLTAVIPVVLSGTMNLNDIGNMQQGWFTNWFVFHDPFSFIAFFVFFVATLASNKRAPFDLAEAESELVAGFLTEYSGFRWSIFFLGEYAAMFFVSALGVVLFLGGWWTGIGPLDDWFVSFASSCWWGDYIVRVAGLKIFLLKSSLLVCVQIWVRWTLPRLRIDQVMTTCLKYLVPIACFLFVGVVLYPLVLLTVIGRSTLLPVPPRGERVPVPVLSDSGDLQAGSLPADTAMQLAGQFEVGPQRRGER
jgi:NADH-quinone oxidoreductase subunit H